MSAISELSDLIQKYLNERPNLSLNALAIRSEVPETTLRRISKGELKRLPKNETILKILSYIFQTEKLREIAERSPTDLALFMKAEYMLSDEQANSPQINLDRFLPDQVSYLVFKLASNSSGVYRGEIERLFGELGLGALEKLLKAAVIKFDGEKYKSAFESFRLSDESFVDNFKAVSNFIKTDPEKRRTPNFYYNLSESLSDVGLRKVREIQVEATRQVLKIMNDSQYHGEIPVFNLVAIDSLN